MSYTKEQIEQYLKFLNPKVLPPEARELLDHPSNKEEAEMEPSGKEQPEKVRCKIC